jgi:hypothetical protein
VKHHNFLNFNIKGELEKDRFLQIYLICELYILFLEYCKCLVIAHFRWQGFQNSWSPTDFPSQLLLLSSLFS